MAPYSMTDGTCTAAWNAWNNAESTGSVTDSAFYSDQVTTWREWNNAGTVYQFERNTGHDTYVFKQWVSDETISRTNNVEEAAGVLREMFVEAQIHLDKAIKEAQRDEYTGTQTIVYINGHIATIKKQVEEIKEKLNRYERSRQRAIEEQKRKAELKKQQEAKRQEKIKQRKLEKAKQRAFELFTDLIGEEQASIFKETGRLFINGRNFDWLIEAKDYERHMGYLSMRKIIKGRVSDLCVHVKEESGESLPLMDKVINLALHAKLDEENFEKTANPTAVGTIAGLYPKGFPRAANF